VPTYQYACTDCADRIEVVQKFTDDPLSVCPSCGGKLRKIFSPVGIVFKGSGFYRTDSRASQKTPEPAAASANGSSDGKSSDGKKTDAASSSGEKSSGSPGSGDKKSGEKAGSSSSSSGSSSSSSPSSSSSGSKVA
jgi:putative FmdB family regulatory protein